MKPVQSSGSAPSFAHAAARARHGASRSRTEGLDVKVLGQEAHGIAIC